MFKYYAMWADSLDLGELSYVDFGDKTLGEWYGVVQIPLNKAQDFRLTWIGYSLSQRKSICLPHLLQSWGGAWIGKYFPMFTPNGWKWPQAVNLTLYDCPHCANEYGPLVGVLDNCGQHTNQIPAQCLEYALGMPTTSKSFSAPLTGTACSNCGRLGHNMRTCTRKRIYDQIGIEIEGRWHEVEHIGQVANTFGAEWGSDCSIGSTPLVNNGASSKAEFKTKPGSVGYALKQLSALYPDETDSTCGLHVHMSFRDTSHITQLCTAEFFDFFANRWRAWGEAKKIPQHHHFWRRLDGQNTYCQKNKASQAIAVSNMWEVDRYTQINFASWSKFKTVEFRLLPMFREHDLSIAAVQELVDMVEDWIVEFERHFDLSRFQRSVALADLADPTERISHDVVTCDSTFDTLRQHSESHDITVDAAGPLEPGWRRFSAYESEHLSRLLDGLLDSNNPF